MKKFSYLSFSLMFLASLALIGCGSGVQTETKAPVDKDKGSFDSVVKDNSNIPDAAKKAMMGSPNPNTKGH
jgi:hypothetical protein